MKIFVISSRFPWPVEKGDKLRLYHQIAHLAREHEVILCSITDHRPDESELDAIESLGIELEYHVIPKYMRWWNVITGIFNFLPWQVQWFYRTPVKRKIQQSVLDHNPDVIYSQLIRTAEYVRALPFPKVLDYMDCFSEGARKRARASGWFRRHFFFQEAKRLSRYEKSVFPEFDRHSVISEEDRNALPIPSREDIRIIPNGVDTDYFTPDHSVAKQYDVAFVGNLGYHPNILAARFLVREILPLLSSKKPDIKVLIAGARPAPEVLQLDSEQVEVSGWMEDIRKAYRSADLFVAPIFSGIGMQNKILEALACGLPVITTPRVAVVIDPESEVLESATTAEDFREAVLECLEDEEKRSERGDRGREFVSNRYGWEKQNERLIDLLLRTANRTEHEPGH